MGNLRFFLIVAVFCAIFGDALSQNRGSVRYGASSNDDTDGADVVENTRPPVPNRSARRRRPTSAPEPPPAAAEIQPHPNEATTGRRVPSRTTSPRFGSQSPSLSRPIEEPVAPVLSEVAYDVPSTPPAVPEDKSQGRRRRPKKRRRPQAEKKDIDIADVKKEGNEPKDVEAKPLRPYHDDSELRNNQNSYDSSGSTVNFGDNVDDPGRINPVVQYFPPQTGTNRLPLENAEEIEKTRTYSEPPQSAHNSGISSRRYVSSEPESSRGSYVPVLNPGRVPTETRDQYPRGRDEVRTRQDRPSDIAHQRRTPEHRSPSPNHDEITRSSDAKSPQNQNTRSSQTNIPSRRHPEVRLVPTELPQISREYDRSFNNQPQYGNPVVVSVLGGQRQAGRLHENDNEHRPPQATNRLPNPSEDHYKPVYPYLDENLNSEQVSHSSLPYRRDETASHISGDAIIPYSNVIPKDTDEPSKGAIDTDNENQELSRYEPPLPGSRASSQSRTPEEDKTELPTRSREPSRSRSQTRTETLTRARSPSSDTPVIAVETPTRQRGASRYQPDSSIDQPTRTQDSTRYASDTSPDTPIRTRGLTRNQPDTSVDQPTRTRGSNTYTTDASLDAITRKRGSTRNQPDASPDTITRTRTSSRRQPDSAIDTPTPTRGSSRRQPNTDVDESTRGSSRYQPDSSIDRPTRTRSSQAEVPSPQRNRNTLRYPTDPEDESRLTSRRQQSIPEVNPDTDIQTYSQIAPERREPNEEAAPAPFSAYAHPTHRPDERDARDPVRNTLRSRPQYEVREPEQPFLYEEPSEDEEDSNVYVPEYQPPQQEVRNQRVPPREQPRQQTARENTDQRTAPKQQTARENTDQRTAPRQQQPDYRSPQPSTRRQPQSQHQAPQNERPQERQPSRQQTRPRQDPVPNHGRSSGASKFACPDAFGFFADSVQCDKYYECRNGTATDGLCDDGLAFNVAAAPRFLRCDSLRDVDCTSRPELQEPRPSGNCPRRYGLYPNEEDCTKFFNCVDGTATQVQCPPGLTFNDDRATCDWADLVKSSCKTEDLLGFTCPEPSAYDLQDGVYTSYPHPDNCQLHFVCIKGEDGERRPRMLACNEGLVYNPQSASCTRPDDVPGCEDFYGSRSPAPKRKPSREPLPAEPEPLDEDPKPRRRVVQQNRRNRN